MASYLCSGRWNSNVNTIIIHKERLYNDSDCPYPARTPLWSGGWIVLCKPVTFAIGPGNYTKVIVSWMSTQSPFFPPSIRSFSFWTFGQLLFMVWLAFRAQKGVFCRIQKVLFAGCRSAARQPWNATADVSMMQSWHQVGKHISSSSSTVFIWLLFTQQYSLWVHVHDSKEKTGEGDLCKYRWQLQAVISKF